MLLTLDADAVQLLPEAQQAWNVSCQPGNTSNERYRNSWLSPAIVRAQTQYSPGRDL
jgi:hypothetical protein